MLFSHNVTELLIFLSSVMPSGATGFGYWELGKIVSFVAEAVMKLLFINHFINFFVSFSG